jgi:hypothetical protein
MQGYFTACFVIKTEILRRIACFGHLLIVSLHVRLAVFFGATDPNWYRLRRRQRRHTQQGERAGCFSLLDAVACT